MRPTLKPIERQVIAITGATSGIGLATAKLAAERGAKVFLIARDEEDLKRLGAELGSGTKGETAYFVGDVGNERTLQDAAKACIARFGRIDTWINNAGVSIYGKITEISAKEARRLFDTNFWGVFHGCRAAIPHLKEAGGALINVGSVLSEVGLPIQGVYSASKFAVKGFTDSLRRELESEKAPISVTLIKPAAIDTPYPEHAESRLGDRPAHTPPVYAPEVVARAILACAEKPVRELGVGSSAKLYPLLDRLFPKLQDLFMSRMMTEKNQRMQGRPARPTDEALWNAPRGGGRVHGDYPGHVMRSSLYTELALRPWLGSVLAACALGAGYYLLWARSKGQTEGSAQAA